MLLRGRISNRTGVLVNDNGGCFGLDCFGEKTTSCTCLFLSGLKDIFHLYAHSEIYSKSLFSLLAEMSGSFTTEKSSVSSAKSLTVEKIFSDKSLIILRKIGDLKWIPVVHHL